MQAPASILFCLTCFSSAHFRNPLRAPNERISSCCDWRRDWRFYALWRWLGVYRAWRRVWCWATLFVNVAGSFILGAMMGWFTSREPVLENTLWLLVGVGMMGAFTTFSAFSRDTVHMFMTGELMKGVVFAGLNMVGALAAFTAGLLALKRLLA